MTDESPGTRKVIVEPCASSDAHDDPKLLPMVTLDDIASELLLHKNLEVSLNCLKMRFSQWPSTL